MLMTALGECLRLFSLQRSEVRLDLVVLGIFTFDIIVNANKLLE